MAWHFSAVPTAPSDVQFQGVKQPCRRNPETAEVDPKRSCLCNRLVLRRGSRHGPMPQQREVTHRFMIMRFRSGATSIAISPRRSASLMAARALALPTLARSAIRATGRVHFPVAEASFRMTASTAIASIFRCSPIEGGTTTVAARNRRPHTTRWTVSDLLLFSTIRVSILD
jgi:hypothetical protein